MTPSPTFLKSVVSNPAWVQIPGDRSGFHYLVSISGRNSSCLLASSSRSMLYPRNGWCLYGGTGAEFQLRHPMQTVAFIRLAKLICRRGDSNPHELPHTPLKRARLPVPPLRLKLSDNNGTANFARSPARIVNSAREIAVCSTLPLGLASVYHCLLPRHTFADYLGLPLRLTSPMRLVKQPVKSPVTLRELGWPPAMPAVWASLPVHLIATPSDSPLPPAAIASMR